MKYFCEIGKCYQSIPTRYALAVHILTHVSKAQKKRWKESLKRISQRAEEG